MQKIKMANKNPGVSGFFYLIIFYNPLKASITSRHANPVAVATIT
jgi:hypothetical protein